MSDRDDNVAVFEFDFDPIFRFAAMPFGIRDDTTGVGVTETVLRIRFGPWALRTPLANVVSAEVTGPYAWPKVIGPPHLSMADRGVTFATNRDEGVCVRFERPVRAIDPLGVIRHPGVTVTVVGAASLAELLDRERQDTHRVHAEPGRHRSDRHGTVTPRVG